MHVSLRMRTVDIRLMMKYVYKRASSLPGFIQLAGKEEDGFLSDVGSWTQFRFPVLFQSYIPVPLLIFLRLICIVVILLQLLQEVTLISYCG